VSMRKNNEMNRLI